MESECDGSSVIACRSLHHPTEILRSARSSPAQDDRAGLVVGLDGTGDRRATAQQVAIDMLKKFMITTDISQFKSENIALVSVTAELSPFARRGSRLDVTVSSMQDAKSLQGGTLLRTPLIAADGMVYAEVQGQVSVSGFGFSGRAASTQKNHPTNGRIPAGGAVVREALGDILCDGRLRLMLRDEDYATARLIAQAIAAKYPRRVRAIDAKTVDIAVPKERCEDLVALVDEIGQLEVMPDAPARVVINERTGTVVAGEHVRISRTAVAHGNIAITTAEDPQVSQPASLSNGETTVVPRTNLRVEEQSSALHVVDRAVTVGDLAKALNALGVTPRDLIAIFQALKQAGALHAELVSM
jgi:flagellar P-ring protein precursor FlgI